MARLKTFHTAHFGDSGSQSERVVADFGLIWFGLLLPLEIGSCFTWRRTLPINAACLAFYLRGVRGPERFLVVRVITVCFPHCARRVAARLPCAFARNVFLRALPVEVAVKAGCPAFPAVSTVCCCGPISAAEFAFLARSDRCSAMRPAWKRVPGEAAGDCGAGAGTRFIFRSRRGRLRRGLHRRLRGGFLGFAWRSRVRQACFLRLRFSVRHILPVLTQQSADAQHIVGHAVPRTGNRLERYGSVWNVVPCRRAQ